MKRKHERSGGSNRKASLRRRRHHFESLENRLAMAVVLELRLEAVDLDGSTPIQQVNVGQEFLLRGRSLDLRASPNDLGTFQVYTDVGYEPAETTPIVSEVQRLDFTGQPIGGSFTLSYNGSATAPISFNRLNQGQVQALAIQNALEQVPELSGNVRVERDLTADSSLPSFRYKVRFINSLAGKDLNQLTVAPTLTPDPDIPNSTAGARIVEVGKGLLTNADGVLEAFAYNASTTGANEITTNYPDIRLGTNEVALKKFDNVGGVASIGGSAVSSGFVPYFTVRMKANSAGDGSLVFTQNMPTELDINMFGINAPIPASDIRFSYGSGGNQTNTGKLTIPIVTEVTAVSDSYTVTEDAAAATLSPSPLANDTQRTAPKSLTISSVGSGSKGGTLTIVNAGKDVQYRPAANAFGQETITYTATDGLGHFSTGTMTITINGVNDAPSFTKGADVTRAENVGAVTIVNWASPVSAGPGETTQTVAFTVTNDNNSLFSVQPAIAPVGTLTFTPAANATGTALVSVTLKDNGGGTDTSAVQTFRITISPQNDAPVNTVPGAQSTIETDPITFQGASAISIADIDAAQADVRVVLSALNGALSVGPSVPAGLTVAGNNTASLTLTGTIAEINTALTGAIYRADAGFRGADTITIVTNDQGNTGAGGAKQDTDTIAITVRPRVLPSAVNDPISVNEDSSNNVINVLANDVPRAGATLVLKSFTTPPASAGTLVRPAGANTFQFTPTANFAGNTSFTYVVNDSSGAGLDSTATVAITVVGSNDAPTAVNNAYTVEEDVVLAIVPTGSVLRNDTDPDAGDTLRAVLVAPPTKGAIVFNADGTFTYTPRANEVGQDTFTYRALDAANAQSNLGTVTISITPANDPPTAVNLSFNAVEDTTFNAAAPGVRTGGGDVDGDALTAVLKSNASKGQVTLRADGSFTYVPKANENGNDTFTYALRDPSNAESPVRTATIRIAAVNDRPIAKDDTNFLALQDTTLAVPASIGLLKNDSDPDGNPITAVIATQAANGTATINADGSFTYRGRAGFIGTDTFTYTASDGASSSLPATVTIRVADKNDPPAAVNKTYSVNEDGVRNVAATEGLLIGASDPEGSSLRAAIVTQPTNGTVSNFLADGSFTYRPAANFSGLDRFTYVSNDGDLNSIERTVTLSVTGVNDLPPIVNDAVAAFKNAKGQLLGNVIANDLAAKNPDAGETLSLVSFETTTAQGGTVLRRADGVFLYTPKADFAGTDSFKYRLGDGRGGQADGTVTINVKPFELSVLAGNVYQDDNGDGLRGAAEKGIGGVKITLSGTDIDRQAVSRTATTDYNGYYSFGDIRPGTYQLVETQPAYIRDGIDRIGTQGGTVANDRFTIVIPQSGIPNKLGAANNFGEGGIALGTAGPNADPLQITLAEMLSSTGSNGVLVASNNGVQQWTRSLDASWSGLKSLTAKASADESQLTVTLVISHNGVNRTYRTVLGLTSSDANFAKFRVMAKNSSGYSIYRIDGKLNLSQFTLV